MKIEQDFLGMQQLTQELDGVHWLLGNDVSNLGCGHSLQKKSNKIEF